MTCTVKVSTCSYKFGGPELQPLSLEREHRLDDQKCYVIAFVECVFKVFILLL